MFHRRLPSPSLCSSIQIPILFPTSPSPFSIAPSLYIHCGVEMLFSRGFYRISRTSYHRCQCLYSFRHEQQLPQSNYFRTLTDSTEKVNEVLGCRVIYSGNSSVFNVVGQEVQYQSSPMVEGIVTAPILFAIEEYPELHAVVDWEFDNPGDVDLNFCRCLIFDQT